MEKEREGREKNDKDRVCASIRTRKRVLSYGMVKIPLGSDIRGFRGMLGSIRPSLEHHCSETRSGQGDRIFLGNKYPTRLR